MKATQVSLPPTSPPPDVIVLELTVMEAQKLAYLLAQESAIERGLTKSPNNFRYPVTPMVSFGASVYRSLCEAVTFDYGVFGGEAS